MFEKYTERARKVMSIARQEATKRAEDFIGTDHILLAILGEKSGVAYSIIERMKIRISDIYVVLEDEMPPIKSNPEYDSNKKIMFTPRVKSVIAEANKFANSLGHDHVGTEHLLYAIYAINSGTGYKALSVAFEEYTEVEAKNFIKKEIIDIYKPKPKTESISITSSNVNSDFAIEYNNIEGKYFKLIGDKYIPITQVGLEINRREVIFDVPTNEVDAFKADMDKIMQKYYIL